MRGERLFEATHDFSSPDARMWSMTRVRSLRSSKIRRFGWCSAFHREESAIYGGARLLEAMSRHIPGKPNIILQNMPGAGSLTAANYIYGVAKPDGLTIGFVTPGLYFNQLTDMKEVQFDWAKFTWIGSPERTVRIIYGRSDTPYKTLDDIRDAPEQPRCGATALGTVGHYFPRLIEEVAGDQVQHRDRLPRRRGNRLGDAKGRSAVSRRQPGGLFRQRTDSDVVQEWLYPSPGAWRGEA